MRSTSLVLRGYNCCRQAIKPIGLVYRNSYRYWNSGAWHGVDASIYEGHQNFL